MEICFATNNSHKLEEVTKAVHDRHFKILSLKELSVSEELPETSDTFNGNALQKALFVFNRIKIPCFADDSGLEVDALNGAPGVFSARYAGPQRDDGDNLNLLLKNLDRCPDRSARFRTVFALVGLGPQRFFEGTVEGRIIDQPRGTHGFGYDPVFIPHGHTRTFAEMTLEEKNKISHRSLALQKLTRYLLTL